MSAPRDPRERLRSLFDALAEQAEAMGDQEVLEDARAAGVDVVSEANRVRDVLLGAVVRAKKERLTVALEGHRRTVSALAQRSARIPSSPSDRRALLMSSLQRRPDVKEGLTTLQHRDFTAFSDADVESVLRQLDALGLLDEDPGRNS